MAPRIAPAIALVLLISGCVSVSPTGTAAPSGQADPPDACASTLLRSPSGRAVTLTGRWRAFPDGGTFYLRHAGSCVWMVGLSPDASGRPAVERYVWTNSYFGKLEPDFTITGQWADLPWGTGDGVGVLDWRVEVNEIDGLETITLVVDRQSGGFGTDALVRAGQHEEVTAQLLNRDDCPIVVGPDGTTYELVSGPSGWEWAPPARLEGPNGEIVVPTTELTVGGEVARGAGHCGPGRVMFVDLVEIVAP